jgi:hypothetical protein
MEIKGKYITLTSPGAKFSDGWSWYHNATGLKGFRICSHTEKEQAKAFLAKYGSDERLNTFDKTQLDLQYCCREMQQYI